MFSRSRIETEPATVHPVHNKLLNAWNGTSHLRTDVTIEALDSSIVMMRGDNGRCQKAKGVWMHPREHIITPKPAATAIKYSFLSLSRIRLLIKLGIMGLVLFGVTVPLVMTCTRSGSRQHLRSQAHLHENTCSSTFHTQLLEHGSRATKPYAWEPIARTTDKFFTDKWHYTITDTTNCMTHTRYKKIDLWKTSWSSLFRSPKDAQPCSVPTHTVEGNVVPKITRSALLPSCMTRELDDRRS